MALQFHGSTVSCSGSLILQFHGSMDLGFHGSAVSCMILCFHAMVYACGGSMVPCLVILLHILLVLLCARNTSTFKC